MPRASLRARRRGARCDLIATPRERGTTPGTGKREDLPLSHATQTQSAIHDQTTHTAWIIHRNPVQTILATQNQAWQTQFATQYQAGQTQLEIQINASQNQEQG